MVKPAFNRNVLGGIYEVTKQLPHNGREFEYRIKSASEEHERVAGVGPPKHPRARRPLTLSRRASSGGLPNQAARRFLAWWP